MALHFEALPMNYLLLGAKKKFVCIPTPLRQLILHNKALSTMSVQLFSLIGRHKLPAETIVYMRALNYNEAFVWISC